MNDRKVIVTFGRGEAAWISAPGNRYAFGISRIEYREGSALALLSLLVNVVQDGRPGTAMHYAGYDLGKQVFITMDGIPRGDVASIRDMEREVALVVTAALLARRRVARPKVAPNPDRA